MDVKLIAPKFVLTALLRMPASLPRTSIKKLLRQLNRGCHMICRGCVQVAKTITESLLSTPSSLIHGIV